MYSSMYVHMYVHITRCWCIFYTPASKRSGISPGYQPARRRLALAAHRHRPGPGNHRAAGADTGGCTLNSTAHVKCGELPGHIRSEDGSPEASSHRLVAGPLRRGASRHRRGRLNPEPPEACAARQHCPAGVAALPGIGPDLPQSTRARSRSRPSGPADSPSGMGRDGMSCDERGQVGFLDEEVFRDALRTKLLRAD